MSQGNDASLNVIEVAQNTEPFQLNNAMVLGEIPQNVLDISLTLGCGRNEHDKRWPARVMSWAQLIGMLSKHKIGPKEGTAFLQGSAIENLRKANAIDALYIMGLDVDAGIHFDWAVNRVKELGLSAVLYTTASHMKTKSFIIQSGFAQFAKKRKIDEHPTLETMKRYLSEALHWEQWVVDTVSIGEDTEHIKRGVAYVLTHDPMPKFRIIFPLDTPYVIAKQRMSQADAIDLWKSKLVGLSKVIGLPIDEATLDPSRLFYMPRHGQANPFQVVVTGGAALDFDGIPEGRAPKGQKIDDNVFSAAAKDLGADGASRMIGDFNLKRWAKKTADKFDICKLFREVAPSRIRADDNTSKLAVDCPFDAFHSNAGDEDDRGAWVQSPSAELGAPTFTFACSHNGCKGRDRLEMIAEAVEQEWFTVDDLKNGQFQTFTLEETSESLTKLLPSFGWTISGGIVNRSVKRGDDHVDVPVCQVFDVVGMGRDTGSDGWSLVIKFRDPDYNEKTFIIHGSKIHKDANALRGELSDAGFTIFPGKQHFEELLSILKPSDRVLIANKPGWVEETLYIAPDGSHIGKLMEGEKDIVLNNRPNKPQKRGTLEGQLRAYEIALKFGGPQYFVMALAGVAGALADFVELESSPVINLSGDTSTGKTTAIRLGASAFGNTKMGDGLMHSLRATANGFELKAAMSNASFLGADETGHMPVAELEPLIFMLASGAGKTRMKRAGGSVPVHTWTTVVGVTSEQPVRDLIARVGRKARHGFTARCMDLDVPNAPIPDAQYDELKGLLVENFGHVGPLFVEALIASKVSAEDMRRKIDQKVSRLESEASAVVRRSAGVIGLLWSAGEILADAGLLPGFNKELVGTRLAKIWEDYRGSDESETLDTDQSILDTLTERLFMGMKRDVQDIDLPHDLKTIAPVAWFRQSNDDKSVTFFVPSKQIAELAGGTSKRKKIGQVLGDAGLLQLRKVGDDMQRTHSTLPGGATVSHYRIVLPLDDAEALQDKGGLEIGAETIEAVKKAPKFTRSGKPVNWDGPFAPDQRKAYPNAGKGH